MSPRSMYVRILLVLFCIVVTIGIFITGVSIGQVAPRNEEQKLTSLKSIGEKQILSKIVAIDNSGKGASAELLTEIRPGTGLVLVNINNVLADFNTQYSARAAALAAKNYTKIDLSNVDIIFNIETNANVIGGQSAGSTMAISVVAGLLNKTLKPNVIMTGSVEADGKVGEAGAIKEKAMAAKEANATLFLVPPGTSTEAKNYKKERNCGNFEDYEYCEIRYVEDKRNLGKNIDLRIVEISTIEEAAGYFFEDAKETL